MDDKYKIYNPANNFGTQINYRNYYVHGKSHLHKWTMTDPPEWIKDWSITTK